MGVLNEQDKLRASLYLGFAYALINVPDSTTWSFLHEMEKTQGKILFSSESDFSSKENEQCFFNRTVVPCTSSFVPLFEQAIIGAEKKEGSWTFSNIQGAKSRHVERCYAQAGFDFKKLAGQPEVVSVLRADSLAAQCAFMAFVLSKSANQADEVAQSEYRDYANSFLRNHLSTWVGKAAQICSDKSFDYYGEVVRLLSLFVEEDSRC